MIRIFCDNSFSGEAELDGFYIFEYTFEPVSRVIGAPIETGQVSFDQKVIDPKRLVVVGKVLVGDGKNTVDIIKRMFENRDYRFYSAELDGETAKNLILQKATHRKSTQEVDVVVYTLEFVEAMIVQSGDKQSKSSENSGTKNTGYTSKRIA